MLKTSKAKDGIRNLLRREFVDYSSNLSFLLAGSGMLVIFVDITITKGELDKGYAIGMGMIGTGAILHLFNTVREEIRESAKEKAQKEKS
jgi:hypothetical protein